MALRRRSTDTSSKCDSDTSRLPLEWTKNKFSAFQQVEAHPVQPRNRVKKQRPVAHHLVYHCEEWIDIERLGKVISRPGRQQPLDLTRCSIGAQDHDWQLGCPGIALQLLQHLRAMHIGQIKIQQNQLGKMD